MANAALVGPRDSAPYLHDGRADTIEEAIRLHGGEASASALHYEKLPAREQAELQFFLLSLAAPDAAVDNERKGRRFSE